MYAPLVYFHFNLTFTMNIVTMARLQVFFILAFSSFFSLFAQQQEATPETGKTLAQQFQELEQRSSNYREKGIRYEIVRLADLQRIKTSVSDSITTANAAIQDLSDSIAKHTSAIEALTVQLQETTHTLNTVTAEKNSMTLLGNTVRKGTYNLILWTVISTLLLLLVFFVYKFKNSNALTRQAKVTLVDLEKEYEAHKRRALEREQKVSRQLQDELNKQKKQ